MSLKMIETPRNKITRKEWSETSRTNPKADTAHDSHTTEGLYNQIQVYVVQYITLEGAEWGYAHMHSRTVF